MLSRRNHSKYNDFDNVNLSNLFHTSIYDKSNVNSQAVGDYSVIDRKKVLGWYIFPSVGSLCVTYLYNIVDGIFVGRGVGTAALGAVNVAVPFITAMVALAAMFPMGGGTIVAIRMGRGDKKGANDAFMTALVLTVLMSGVLMAIGMIFPRQIAILCGSSSLSNEMLDMAAEYIFYYVAFSIPMLMSTCLSVFVRNDGSPSLAFWAMCIGAAANIFLDWLFIFPLKMGIVGAAIASGLGQIVSFVMLLFHFILKRGDLRIGRFKVQRVLVGKVCKRGVPEAVSQLNTPVTALCYNLVLAKLIGDIGVSTFSVLSFIFSLANAILSGVSQGLQPLWGQHYGKKDAEGIQYYFRWGMIINLLLSIVIYSALFVFNEQVIEIFNKDPILVTTASAALPIFAASFIPMAANLIFTAVFFSTKRTVQANVIAISRGIVVKAFCICLVPVVFGESAVWTAAVLSEIITLAIGIILWRTDEFAWR